MPDLPGSILHVLTIFTPLFSKPVFSNVLLLFVGHILTKGRRTIADILRTLNLHNVKNFSKFHWVLSKAKWSGLKAAKILFNALINFFCLEEVVIPIDTHVERRRGEKIQGLGRQRDAVRSSKNKKVLTTGLLWLVASVSIKLPFCLTPWALPFFSQLIPPKRPLSSSRNRKDLNSKKKRKTLTQWTVQVVKIIGSWLKNTPFIIVADSAFACHAIAHACVKAQGALVSRMRMDARIFHFPDPNKKRKGRPLLVGKRCPLFSDYLKSNDVIWESLVVNWYGGKEKQLLVYSGVHLWYAYGIPPLPIRWVLIKDPTNQIEPIVLFSTNVEHTPKKIIEVFVSRWAIEVTFEECRRHLGIETQRQWSDLGIARTTPCLFGSFSIITLMAIVLSKDSQIDIPIQETSWYNKTHVTFSDMLSYVKLNILRKKYYSQFDIFTELGINDFEELIQRAVAA
jgi:hypothetical protein